ncbi:adenylate cyclase AcyA [Talaromyces stipitatus ATCC 10500]|uniref:Adenylate cyclase n=1 Tax=Talaromyces stipitatus (strain ATCC 10500 / CBS 375.48 / QM 6759 / NRRL 1006) TaxID=441959 RepID=B8M322_TALSN|nr:adenylate cyclase AcyA [Talaromyces stipitatus ATCC 10500]EED21998.1 adenylate cyclase AcyA [Talaromyces stipitatus ATCC 10500]
MARRNGDLMSLNERHGSESSTSSYRSQSTVRDDTAANGLRNGNGNGRQTPSQSGLKRYPSGRQGDAPTPPELYTSMFSHSPSISPTDLRRPGPGVPNHRKALAILGADDYFSLNSAPPPPPPPASGSYQITLNPIAHDPFRASWAAPASPASPVPQDKTEPFHRNSGTFLQDASEHEVSPITPSFRPGSEATSDSDVHDFGYKEFRRESAASATSSNSKSSQNGHFRKRLHGFFGNGTGDENASAESSRREHSEPNTRNRETPVSRHRNDSTASKPLSESSKARTISPRPSRPLTPAPSSEVTPWIFQQYNDIPHYGEAPIRKEPTGPDSQRFTNGKAASINSDHKSSHKLPFPGRRHSRSKEGKPTSAGSYESTFRSTGSANPQDADAGSHIRDAGGLLASTAMSSTSTLAGRPTSPTPSAQSSIVQRDTGSGHDSPGPKRGFIRHWILGGSKSSNLKSLPGSEKNLHDAIRSAAKGPKRDTSPYRHRQGSLDDGVGRHGESLEYDRKKDGRGLGIRSHGVKKVRKHTANKSPTRREENYFPLDTNLDNMEGIVSGPRPLSPNNQPAIFDGTLGEDRPPQENQVGDWNAPDSWRVIERGDDVVRGLPEIDDELEAAAIHDSSSYFIRVFRIDSTFATLSAPLHATVSDILELLGKKSFLQDDLKNYEIVMRKNDLSRQLEHGERPILLQKRLLEQVGYLPKDRIEDVGREDHSYICRFIFLPTKLNSYVTLDADPGFNKSQKFSHVDLQGRSLATIPISLYKRAPEIISLNLSRNLDMDVPSDFITSCINLREIKFMSNEAWRLPASFRLATRLTYLDASNNRLDTLDHTDLSELHGLVSIKLANNKLSSLPNYFRDYSSLRSLTLSSNNFKIFPDFLCDLPNLVDLDISFNSIRELPHIGRLTQLERLWVTNNKLSGPLDKSFQGLKSIKEIDARFNDIENVDSIMQLPRLEQLLLGHNAVTRFRGSFPKLRTLVLDHCPITQFELDAPIQTLTSLNIASGKLVQLKDSTFENLPNLTKLILDKNFFSSLSTYIGKLRRLEHFSIIKNPLKSLPPTIGCLSELKHLNLRECNLERLPSEIWFCLKLEHLNVSSNILDGFPKHTGQPPVPPGEYISPSQATTPGLSNSPSYENMASLDEVQSRRPSQNSGGLLSLAGGSPSIGRNNSLQSNYVPGSRKASTASRAYTDGSGSTRKDSNFAQRLATTFSGSLRNLYLADNRLEDDVFRELAFLPELRVLNLSYNALTEVPQGYLKRWQNLTDIFLSGNELASLPSDDLEETSNLKTIHLNGNRFQVLPAELCKVSKLAILDVGSNLLKYNVSNWPYDWNWNWNRNLKYLNFSGNKRLEIKPNIASLGSNSVNGTDLTGFNSLTHLRILGLMDVTLTIKTVPEETEDRRVRTSASLAGSLAYGMADFLGKDEHLSIIDMMVPRLRSDNMDTLVGMFDGQSQSIGGSKIAKFLHENFTHCFVDELKKLSPDTDTPLDALRRTFLTLNKDMAGAAYKSIDDKEVRQFTRGSTAAKLLSKDDIHSGGVATVLYLRNMDLYVANVGDAQAVLVKSDGTIRPLTFNHDPAETGERNRIREAGGFVSRNGKLNDVLPVSRAFGYFPLIPSVVAAPHTAHFTLTEQDEMIIMASREVWDYITFDLVVDVARAERRDLMIASQKIRDLAIAFGASNKLMVMIVGVSELKKRERYRKLRNASLSVGPSSFPEEVLPPKRARRARDAVGDSRLARFNFVDAPVGDLAIIFTDIKKSTSLWETCPEAMRSAIQIHNDILRRQLGIVGGYEVKTEGDAFMVAFSTTSAALLWCFNCQTQLLEAEWPKEILEQPQCKERYDKDGNLIFRGLSVRMGTHWGEPVCEKDPVTNRMDYFGPMVNRASRISAVADGGQIFVSSDFMSELQRTSEVYAESERSLSVSSESDYGDPLQNIRRELQQLNSQGFIVKDQGEKKLKGLENPESVYLILPHSLSGRLAAQEGVSPDEDLAPATIKKGSQLDIRTDEIWQLWEITLRLERLCSSLEAPETSETTLPNRQLMGAIQRAGGELADATILSIVESQVTRIENCINTLAIRHMMHPFKQGGSLRDHAMTMAEVISQLQSQLAEFQALKDYLNTAATGAPDPAAIVGRDLKSPSSDSSRVNSNSSSHIRLLLSPPSPDR